MFLIASLGNVGSKYQFTKHNFGFLLADKIIADYSFIEQKTKFSAPVFTGQIADNKILLLKPQQYMNNSGIAVQQISSFYKIPTQNIIALHDDLDVPLGRVKAKIGGGNAGHNGLKDIDAKIGKNYSRIRLGIGRPENINYEISDYVLSKFSANEMKIVNNVNEKISDNFDLVLKGDLPKFLNNLV
jgi:peptidyl-tRNA hydrolase, PTH1 family